MFFIIFFSICLFDLWIKKELPFWEFLMFIANEYGKILNLNSFKNYYMFFRKAPNKFIDKMLNFNYY